MELYKLFTYNFNKISKVFRLKRQLNQIFYILLFSTVWNLFFNFIMYKKINKLFDKIDKDNNKNNEDN
jgi:hypothetical protein